MNRGKSGRIAACACLFLGTIVAPAQSQQRLGAPDVPTAQVEPALPNVVPSAPANGAPFGVSFPAAGRSSTYLTGNRDFPNFIGFMSNPIMSIDPRAVTELWPMFGSSWSSTSGPLLLNGNTQIYGAGLYLALSDRLSIGVNQGGYAVVNVNSDRERLLARLGLPIPERAQGGQREGWLNLGGFAQYTLCADVERQFILTAGMRWEAPSGATQVFQGGANPVYLAPFLTAGKELGCWHVLATTGYEFPAGTGTAVTDTFYLNVHHDP